MLPPPGPSPATIAARRRRGEESLALSRRRVLDRHGLTEADVAAMTDQEAEHSGLGREMMFEIAHSDVAKDERIKEETIRKQEDEADVDDRRKMVLAENAESKFPYPPKKIRALLRKKRKEIEQYSGNLYWIEMTGGSSKDNWKPSVDMPAVIDSMTAEAIHKQAYWMVGESQRLTKLSRRQRQAQFLVDVPKFVAVGAAVGAAIILGFLLLGVAADLLNYLGRAPTVVATRHMIGRTWNWLFSGPGLATMLLVVVAMVVFGLLRRRLKRFLRSR